MTDAQGHVSRNEYDPAGNTSATVDAALRRTSYHYDNANRVIQTTFPDGTTTSATYDFRDQPLTQTDQAGHVTLYDYDVAGQLTSMTLANGTADAGTIRFTYDAAGHKLTESDPLGRVTTFAYEPPADCQRPQRAGPDDHPRLRRCRSQNQHHRSRRSSKPLRLRRARPRHQRHLRRWQHVCEHLRCRRSRADADRPGWQGTRLSYDAAGHLLGVTDPLSQVTG